MQVDANVCALAKVRHLYYCIALKMDIGTDVELAAKP